MVKEKNNKKDDSNDLPLVLLVDDEPMNIEVIKAMLQEHPVKLDICINGQQALDAIKERVRRVTQEGCKMYKVILLDYSMPDMDGPQVAIELRHMLQRAGLQIPYICCCTAYSEASYKKNALAVGMDQCISKPVSYNELITILSLVNDD